MTTFLVIVTKDLYCMDWLENVTSEARSSVAETSEAHRKQQMARSGVKRAWRVQGGVSDWHVIEGNEELHFFDIVLSNTWMTLAISLTSLSYFI